MMTKEQVYREIQDVWGLNDNTTLKEIKEFYKTITGLDNLSISQKLKYLYEYILDSMLRDNDITIDLYIEIKNELIGQMSIKNRYNK